MQKVIIFLLIAYYGAIFGIASYTEEELKQICYGHEFEFMAHPNNSKYIICLQNRGLEQECPIGECFNVLKPPCDATCPISNENDIERCNDPKMKPLTRIPDSQDCEQYYLCMGVNKGPMHLKCPSNQHFSEKKGKCMNVKEANCAAKSKWCQNKKDGTIFSAEKCFEYYECRGKETIKKSCAYQQHFNAKLGKCVRGICAGDTRKPNCKDVAEGTRMVHPKCYKYYVCLNNSLFEVQCGSGSYFEANAKMCVRDLNNVCNDE